MTAEILIATSSGIVGTLGLAHLVLTLRGPKLLPRDPNVSTAMGGSHLVITRQTTVWRAWIGFNLSHSLGALLFGLVFGYLALAHGDLLLGSVVLQTIGIVTLATYVLLAKLYWFVTPLVGTSTALLCFLAAVVLGRIG